MRPINLPIRGCHPLWLAFPGHSGQSHGSAGPRSLAATEGVSVDFLSSGYLDVSVPRVRFLNPMYSGKRYLVMPTVDIRKDNNSKQSGGFPHSEIHGSKPIPGSPWLIAGYHVLHRLLLPRHPPNALLALDPIQRRTGPEALPLCGAPPVLAQTLRPARSSRKSYIFPPHARVRTWNIRLVYLTWNKTAREARIPAPPRSRTHSGEPNGSDVSLSSQCHTSSRSDETALNTALSDQIHTDQPHTGQWWSLSGSNR